jgi:hypothetical protein
MPFECNLKVASYVDGVVKVNNVFQLTTVSQCHWQCCHGGFLTYRNDQSVHHRSYHEALSSGDAAVHIV